MAVESSRWGSIDSGAGPSGDNGRDHRHGQRHYAGRYTELVVRFRAQFCYVEAHLEPGPPPAAATNSLELCRLRFFGPDRWSLAMYSYAHERYEPSVFADGEFVGRAEDGFDLAANLYLQ